MKVFKRGGFIIVIPASIENPIPIANFDYKISHSTVKIHDIGENVIYSEDVSNIENESGVAIGDATAIATYFATITTVSGGGGGGDATAANQLTQVSELQKLTGANSPSHQELTDPSSVSISSFKKLSFVCTGAITVTIDGNAIVYPKDLGSGSIVFGAEFEADDVSLNAATFDGTGTVLLTIKQ